MNYNKVVVITSWDDVSHYDLKLFDLLDTYKLKGSFYVIGNLIGKKISEEQLLQISECHEIGAHTIGHSTLTALSYDQARVEIVESKKYLEKCLKKEITSFAYPKGKYNKDHVEIVKNAGYICARTIEPFYFNDVKNKYEIPVSLWAFPHRLRDVKGLIRLSNIYSNVVFNPFLIKNWNQLGREIFDILIERGGIFHLFGHAWQVDNSKGWERLEDLFSHLAFRKDVIYTTLTDYVRTFIRDRSDLKTE